MAAPGPAPTLSPLLPLLEGGRGGNRDQPGASMSRREGSLGKGLKCECRVPKGSSGRKGWKLGSGSPPPSGRGRERPERGRAGPGCQVTSGELWVSCGKVLAPEFRGGLGLCLQGRGLRGEITGSSTPWGRTGVVAEAVPWVLFEYWQRIRARGSDRVRRGSLWATGDSE